MSASAFAIPNPPGKQTGPRTEIGKQRSSANATLHGGTSTKLILAGESQTDFDALLDGLREEYLPDTVQSEQFVIHLATAHWFLRRRQRACIAIEAAVYENEPNEANWTEQHLKRLSLAGRYRTQAERALNRALANIESWRKNNRKEADREHKANQWRAGHALRERRLALQEEKFRHSQLRRAEQPFRFEKHAVGSSNPEETPLETEAARANPALDLSSGDGSDTRQAA